MQPDLITSNPRDMTLGRKIIDLQTELTLTNVNYGKRTFQIEKIEKGLSVKFACAIIANFNAAITTTLEKMDELAIYEAAVEITNTFTHEPLIDLILCLRMAKKGELGIIYNRIDSSVILNFYKKYLEIKYKALEDDHLETKSRMNGSVNTEASRDIQVAERVKKGDSAVKGLELSAKNKKIGELLAENETLKQNKNGSI